MDRVRGHDNGEKLSDCAQNCCREMTRLDGAAARRRVESLSLHAKTCPCRHSNVTPAVQLERAVAILA
jgi:hypothetical protein